MANWSGKHCIGMLESRCKVCDRPQKGVVCCGRQMICVIEGGHGQRRDKGDAGACEMMTSGVSWYNLTALAM